MSSRKALKLTLLNLYCKGVIQIKSKDNIIFKKTEKTVVLKEAEIIYFLIKKTRLTQ